MPSETTPCYCGHAADEHARNKFGHYAECTVEGCGCVHFEADESEEDDDA